MISLFRDLQETGIGYELSKEEPKLNHLLFMDGLKLSRINSKWAHWLRLHTVAIKMFKCNLDIQIMNRAKRVNNYAIHLLEVEAVADPQETVYKYLGILKLDSI